MSDSTTTQPVDEPTEDRPPVHPQFEGVDIIEPERETPAPAPAVALSLVREIAGAIRVIVYAHGTPKLQQDIEGILAKLPTQEQ